MRSSRVRICVFVAAILPLLLLPCTAQESAGDFSISGTVVNSVTGEPVRQALITINGEAAGTDPQSRFLEVEPVLADSSGTFHIRGLRAATYSLQAEKPGFSTDSEGGLKLGPSREGVVIRLTPLGSISGRVLDADGEPVANVAIRAFRSRIRSGRRELSQSNSVNTDDLGRYHLWNLEPGAYCILAAGRSAETRAYVGQGQSVAGSHEGFEPVYYPGTGQKVSATPIKMVPGAAFEADLQVVMQPAFRVRGVLRGHDPTRAVTIQAFRAGVGISAARATVNPASGRFEIHDLVPGTYVIRATQGERGAQARAQREVRIGGADVDAVTLDMASGVDVKAVVQSHEPQTGSQQEPQRRRSFTFVHLYEVDAEDAPKPFVGSPDERGNILISGVPPGRYRLEVKSDGYAASVLAGGQDLLRGGLLVVAPGVAPPTIEIVTRSDFGAVTGTVADENAGPDLWALLAPVGAVATPVTMDVQNGKFESKRVAPGDYRAYLLNSLDTIEYANPDVLSALRGGESLRVAAGESVEIVLKELAQ
ncbi:MAG TPA: carboxypeptidase-like regulatory domain-containing protein [Bryobacteraceae bacterium]|nr:carboxypeptidase-like regulatory domain-containing protein [Bryobacteraceae bacterium]